MHHQTSPLLTKRRSKPIPSVLIDHIPKVRLSTKFVYPLSDLVTCSVSETWEKGDELLGDGRIGG